MGKVREHLLLKLRPIATGNHGHLDDAEKVMQQCRHLGIERRLAFGKCAVQVENDELFHILPFLNSGDPMRVSDPVIPPLPVVDYSGSATSNKLTARPGRKAHAPTSAGKSKTSPLPTG